MTATPPHRIAIIGGGKNAEHEVSLASAAALTRAVHSLGAIAVPLTITRSGGWSETSGSALSAAQAVSILGSCDLALPMVHGVGGEDGAIAGFLEMIGVRFVGYPVRAGAVGMDKGLTKLLARELGITTAPAIRVETTQDALALNFDRPLVVKPTSGGSSNGLALARSATELLAAIAAIEDTGDTALVERFIPGREVDIAVFRDRHGELRVGAALEITKAAGALFDRDQKYDGTAQFTVPAALSTAEEAELFAHSRSLYTALGCSGVVRCDFVLTATGPILNEVNTTPGFTEFSQVPLMFAAQGLSYTDVVAELIAAAGP